MGIRGLTSFIDAVFTGWQQEQVQGHLVIDGLNLCHQLYCSDWAHGGQYPEFQKKVFDFLQALLKSEILPILVFDGIDYKQEKTEVVAKRRKESIRYVHERLASNRTRPAEVKGGFLPMIAPIVFMETARELQIPIYVLDGEADPELVRFANWYTCPILSGDSDFYIYHIHGGYIPFDRFHWKSIPIVAEVFYVRAFIEQFKFKHYSLRYLIPAIVGNDFLPSLFSSSFSRYVCENVVLNVSKCHRLLPVVRYASTFQSFAGFIDQIPLIPKNVNKKALEDNCYESERMYDIQSTQNPEDLKQTTELKYPSGTTIPEWLLHRYRHGNLLPIVMEAIVLGKCFLGVLAEDTQQHSAFCVSQYIRQCIYCILQIPTVTEVYRHGLDLSGNKVLGITMACREQLPHISTIPNLSLPEREHLMCQVLGCDPTILEGLGNKWKLVVVSTIYWATNGKVPHHLVKALIVSFLLCSTCSSDLPRIQKSIIPLDYRRSSKWIIALHAFSQWQGVYCSVITLNQVLKQPMEPTSVATLYDGKIAMFTASSRNIDCQISTYPIDRDLYDMLIGSVLSHKSVAVAESNIAKSKLLTPDHHQGLLDEQSKQERQPYSTFVHGNPFSLLANESESDEADTD